MRGPSLLEAASLLTRVDAPTATVAVIAWVVAGMLKTHQPDICTPERAFSDVGISGFLFMAKKIYRGGKRNEDTGDGDNR